MQVIISSYFDKGFKQIIFSVNCRGKTFFENIFSLLWEKHQIVGDIKISLQFVCGDILSYGDQTSFLWTICSTILENSLCNILHIRICISSSIATCLQKLANQPLINPFHKMPVLVSGGNSNSASQRESQQFSPFVLSLIKGINQRSSCR